MFTTLSTTRSATSGIEPSVNTDGVAWAGVAPERKAAPVPTRPTTAAAARKLRKAVIFFLGGDGHDRGRLWVDGGYESSTSLWVASIPRATQPIGWDGRSLGENLGSES